MRTRLPPRSFTFFSNTHSHHGTNLQESRNAGFSLEENANKAEVVRVAMSLKIARGVSNLGHLPKRVKVIAVVFLGLMAVATMVSEGSNMAAIGESTGRSKEVDGADKTQTSGDVALQSEVMSGKNEVPASDPGKTAKIVTCPRCRLNSLPLVKKFVYDHAKLFEPQLKVDFILGEDPVLYLYENEKEVSKIVLEVSLHPPWRCDNVSVNSSQF